MMAARRKPSLIPEDHYSEGTPETVETPASEGRSARIVDNTDWLKTAAIIFVLIDHIGYFLYR
jgi:hypothetical protein